MSLEENHEVDSRAVGARDWSRTSTTLRPPGPEPGASTNFATRAPGGDYGGRAGASIKGLEATLTGLGRRLGLAESRGVVCPKTREKTRSSA